MSNYDWDDFAGLTRPDPNEENRFLRGSRDSSRELVTAGHVFGTAAARCRARAVANVTGAVKR